MKLGIVCVHYHAADLAESAVAAVRRDAEGSGVEYELVIVDNGSTGKEREQLGRLGTRVLSAAGNSGYAGGVNLGARALLPGSDALVAMNPDVLVEPGCLERLARELKDGAAVAGPRFYWDEVGGYLLPPTERYGRLAELLRVAAGRGEPWARLARGSWRRHARRHWSARGSVASWDLSGALLAMSADAWTRVGPFDEGYRLYFEETDWLYRCRRHGLSGRFVGDAVAVHLYAQSTPREPRAQGWFAESSARFRRLHYGPRFTSWLTKASGGKPPDAEASAPEIDPRGTRVDEPSVRWVEISPSPSGFPAAARRIEAPFGPLVSEALWSRMTAGRYWVRTVSSGGREGPPRTFVKEPSG